EIIKPKQRNFPWRQQLLLLHRHSTAESEAGISKPGTSSFGSSSAPLPPTASPPSERNSSPPLVEVKSFPVESITALTTNSEGTYIVGGGASGDIFIWEVATGKLLKKWHAHYSLRFSNVLGVLWRPFFVGFWISRWVLPLFLYLALVLLLGSLIINKGSTKKELSMNTFLMSIRWLLWWLQSFDSFCFNALALDPGGSVFYSGGGDGKIYIGALNSSSDYATHKAITCLAYCADGNLLISGSEGGVICVWNPRSRQPVGTFTFGHGKGPVNNIQVVVGNANKGQSSWKRNVSSLPPPLEKYERKGDDDTMDGIVIVYPPPSSDVPVYSSYHSADLINEQVKELEQQGSAATEIEMERLKLEYKKSIQMNDQWQKNYENLLQVVMEEELNGGCSN
ncbi:LOW QUALITY PROTEIN: hypothetical protein HID58_022206, partial [Brassica napus]